MKKILLLSVVFLCYIPVKGQKVEKWKIFELELKGAKVENPFTDVQLSAEFTYKNRSFYVDGFYDGNQTYKIRFMPNEEGEWRYKTSSNVEVLNNKTGTFECTPASEGNHGPVRVRDTFHFRYADGTPFYPLGTTTYAWVHQEKELRRQTIETLADQDFNKIRMTVMPKQYGKYIQNEPPYYPFEGSKEEGWNFKSFNVKYFQHFEKHVEKLRDLGIQADIILFHPYDWGKWGFNVGTREENILYLRYLIARIAAYNNVWWSMANEFDIMNKPEEEWEAYFKTLTTYDPYQHLRSIHNGKEWYDYSEPWITHLSVQTPYLQDIQDWRETYEKPVIDDELVYEGNIPHDWGNLTAREMVNRFWICYTRGAYASHGETYQHPDNILWWSKGGKLYGESPERLSFLLEIMKDAPEKNLKPFHNEWNKEMYLYKGNEYFLFYYGNSQQASALLDLPENRRYKIEVIDAWEMTINELEGEYSGETEVPLPEKPYMAVRVKGW
ncbi:MAG: DUF5060 domain-containing protein [Bacteroidales bacterium]